MILSCSVEKVLIKATTEQKLKRRNCIATKSISGESSISPSPSIFIQGMFEWRPFLSAKEVFLGGQRKEGLVGRQHFSRILWRGQKEKPRIKEVGPFLARLLIILARVDCQLFFPCSKQKFSHQRKKIWMKLEN